MKSKSMLFPVLVLIAMSAAVAPKANAEFLCQAQYNAYLDAVAAFNANPTSDNALAVANASARYTSCSGVSPHPL